MAHKKLLFLLGGSAACEAYADEFVDAAAGRQANMAVLVQTRAGWEKYRAEVTKPWIKRGVTAFRAITPNEEGSLDFTAACRALEAATGILICGGSTPIYHRLFVPDPIGAVLREKYEAGTPVAGISAGALITLGVCQLAPRDTGSSEVQIIQALGLASGFVAGVHFTEWNALPEVLEVMARTETGLAFGIDEPACVVCEDGKFARALGQSVFRIRMTDFGRRTYQITREH